MTVGMPQLEKPTEFNQIVMEFLKQQGRLTSERARELVKRASPPPPFSIDKS